MIYPKWPSTHAPSHTTIKTFLNSFYLLLFILLNVPLPVSLVTFFFLKHGAFRKKERTAEFVIVQSFIGIVGGRRANNF